MWYRTAQEDFVQEPADLSQLTDFTDRSAENSPPSDQPYVGPGETQIPDTHVRIFHNTSLDPGVINSIRQRGLTMEQARGNSYGEPNMIWGHTDLKSANDYGARSSGMVEFQVPKNRFVQHAQLPPRYNFGNTPEEQEAEFSDHWGGSNHVAFYHPVPPEDILAIHEPWHDKLLYLRENPEALEAMQDSGMPDYERAAEEFLKEKSGIRVRDKHKHR